MLGAHVPSSAALAPQRVALSNDGQLILAAGSDNDVQLVPMVWDGATGMSTSWADYDRDGWMDVFIANMWSSAGNRITFQEQFQTDATPEAKRRFQRVARGRGA